MSTICGHCHREFPFRYTALMIWCRKDELYVCRRCWEEKCGEGHGKGDENRNWHPLRMFIVVTIGLLLLAPFAVYGVLDIGMRTSWSRLGTTRVADVEEGDIVLLKGFINASADKVAIGGKEHHSDNNDYWVWNEDDEFMFSDDSGSAWVTTERFYEIEDGYHRAPNEKYTDARVYKGQDDIIIVGKVANGKGGDQGGDDGNRTIYLLWAGKSRDDIAPAFGSYLRVGGVLLFIAVVYGYVVNRSRKRGKLHRNKTAGVLPRTIPGGGKMDSRLEWKSNVKLPRSLGLVTRALYPVIGVLIIWAAVLFFRPHSTRDYLFLCFGVGMIATVTAIMSFEPFYERNVLRPQQIAASEKGVHFFYDNPVIALLRDELIAWGEIEDFSFHEPKEFYRKGYFIINKKNDTSEELATLTRKNGEFLHQEWMKRKPEDEVVGELDESSEPVDG